MVKVLADMRLYKGQLDDVIAALDRLAQQRGEKPRGGKRGRPLKASATAAEPETVKRRKRKPAKSTSSA